MREAGPTTAPAGRGSPRFWAAAFVASGVVALACVPTHFVVEHFHWPEWPVNGALFAACVVCAVGALMYLLATRGRSDGGARFGFPTRTLAYIALGLAGGFLLFCAVVLLLLALSPPM